MHYESKHLILNNDQVTTRDIDGLTTYISNDFETNTLMSTKSLCEILP